MAPLMRRLRELRAIDKRRALTLALPLLLAVSAIVRPSAAQTPQAAEPSVKAAYIYRFLGYAEWPAEKLARPNSPVVVGVMGADEVAAELEQVVAGRQLNGRPLVVRRMTANDTLGGIHALYVGRSPLRPAMLSRARAEGGVLTITDVDGGLELGAVINFVHVDNKLRFEVALNNADKSGLKMSSRLLAVAVRVRSDG